MKKTISIITKTLAFAATASFLASCASAKSGKTLSLAEQGNFSAGGIIATNEGELNSDNLFASYSGQTTHADHASIFYQIPENRKKLSIVFLHGNGQSARCWGTTPDGRDGFQTLFLRDGFGVYLVDQPRRGQAANISAPATVNPDFTDQMRFEQFRLGIYPNFYERSAFPKDEKSLDNFYRQMTSNVGSVPMETTLRAFDEIFEKSGDAIFFTHSAGGNTGWREAMRSKHVKAIVAFEPGSFIFAESDAPEAIPNKYVNFPTMTVPDEDFVKLAKIPIIVYFGDNIPKEHSEHVGEDFWYAVRETGYKFAEKLNALGGDVTIVSLPDEGIYGNTHFPFSDSNNNEVKTHLDEWLHKKGLDK